MIFFNTRGQKGSNSESRPGDGRFKSVMRFKSLQRKRRINQKSGRFPCGRNDQETMRDKSNENKTHEFLFTIYDVVRDEMNMEKCWS